MLISTVLDDLLLDIIAVIVADKRWLKIDCYNQTDESSVLVTPNSNTFHSNIKLIFEGPKKGLVSSSILCYYAKRTMILMFNIGKLRGK